MHRHVASSVVQLLPRDAPRKGRAGSTDSQDGFAMPRRKGLTSYMAWYLREEGGTTKLYPYPSIHPRRSETTEFTGHNHPYLDSRKIGQLMIKFIIILFYLDGVYVLRSTQSYT